MKPLTEKLLTRCKEAGYTTVTIGKEEYVCHPGISCSPETTEQRIDGFPAIWDILDKLSLRYGCGAGHSHQIHNRELPKLDIGTWKLRNGKWTMEVRNV